MNDSLYQKAIVELARRRRDDTLPSNANAQIRQHNPLCGDTVILSLTATPPNLEEVFQQVRGCLLCSAATQTMLDIIAVEKELQRLQTTCAAVETMFADNALPPELAAFAPVREHPARHECVLLPFRALSAALNSLR